MYLLHPTGHLKLSFGTNLVQITKTSIYKTSRMLFSNIDFNFDDFDHFHFAHFEIEENFGYCIQEVLSKFGEKLQRMIH